MKCRGCGRENQPGRESCEGCRAPLLDPQLAAGMTDEDREAVTALGAPPVERGALAGELTGTVFPAGAAAGLTSEATGATGATGELILGRVLGNRYEILSILGQGGMGRVYKARDRELDKLIALKTIRLDTVDAPDAVQRFKQELLLARNITHKNVVRIFDLGEAEGSKFFTMEYIEGDDLKSLIRRGKVPPEKALDLSRQILSALAEAHAQGVVHRDLKPQNVMVEPSGKALLMDFGIARIADSTGMTATGTIVGTPDYMSPEQVKGEKAVPASDVFAFGVILYELLTGELPYQAETPVSKVMMRLSHTPRAIREITAEVPKFLEKIVRRCLEIDPELRYADAAAVLADLEREQSSGVSLRLRVQREVRRRRGPLLAAAAVVGLVGIGGLWLATRPTGGTADSGIVAPEGPVHAVAILPFTNATGSEELEWMREGLTEMLITDLSQSRYVRPVPGERIIRVMRELGAEEQTRFDEATLESISQRAGAGTVLYGQFIESGGTLRLDMTLRRAGSGVPVPIKAEGTTSDVFGLVDRIAGAVKEHLDLTPEQIKGDAARPFTEVATSSVEALRAYQKGLGHLRQGSVQEALPHLRDATGADPGFAMAWTRLAEALLDAGEQREAEAAVGRARSLSETTPLPLAQRYQVHAIAATVEDDLETAATSYTELTKLFPDDPDAHYRLAVTQRNLGHQAEAVTAYERVLELSPGYGAAEIELAGVLWQAGNPEKAIETLEGALAGGRFADDVEALGTIHSIMGVAYRDSGQLDDALKNLDLSFDYRRQAGDKRGQAVTLTNLASVYEEQGQIAQALAAEETALAIAREMRDEVRESFVLNNMGITYSVAGDLDKALEAFRESMQIETERGNAADLANRLDKIADVYRLMGRYDDALIYLEHAGNQLEETDAQEEVAINRHLLGLIHAARGQYAEGLEAFLAALSIFEEMGQQLGVGMVHEDVAHLYARQGRFADARGSLEKAFEIYESLNAQRALAEVRVATGALAARLGQADEAEERLGATAGRTGRSGAGALEIEARLGEAELFRLRGRDADAGRALREAAAQAGQAGLRELELRAQVALGQLELERGRTAQAETLALAASEEARRVRLRPIEAEARVVLSAALLAREQGEPARQTALDAISLAERYEGRPVLVQARAALASALEALGQHREAVDAWSAAAADLEWIRGSLRPKDIEAYMARGEVQSFLDEALPRLDEAGRAGSTASLRRYGKGVPQRMR